jgi:Arc/MetJ-type ribon-helix-helix transcriptional regulator
MEQEAERRKYTTIHIPIALARLIDTLIDTGEFAYTSRAEFVKDSIRRALEKHGFYPDSKPWLKEIFDNDRLREELDKRLTELREIKSLLQTKKSGKT